MKYCLTMAAAGNFLTHLVSKDIPEKGKEIRREYRAILERASDIGSRNKLLSSYVLCAFFIAMVRKSGLTPEENIGILEKRMRNSRMLKAFLGDSKSYFSSKAMESRRKWSALTHDPVHRKQYPNDWVVDFLEGTEEYVFGFDYRECGVCKLCRDENCPELAGYLCSLDYMLVELMGLGLRRTQVLAEGADSCDFRFLKK